MSAHANENVCVKNVMFSEGKFQPSEYLLGNHWCNCVSELTNKMYLNPNYKQQDATFLDLFISTDALHVSGGSSAHHQEHIPVHTASGIYSWLL